MGLHLPQVGAGHSFISLAINSFLMCQPEFLIKTSSSLSDKTAKFVTIVLPIVAGVVVALVLLLLYRRWRQREHKNALKSKSVKIGADFQ